MSASVDDQSSIDPGLDIPTIEIPTDATLAEIARKQIDESGDCSSLFYYFLEGSGKYKPLVTALRAAWLDGCLTAAAVLAGEEVEDDG